MSAGKSTVGQPAPTPQTIAAEIIDIWGQFASLSNSRQRLVLQGVGRLPNFDEVAVLAARIGFETGLNIEEVEEEGSFLNRNIFAHDSLHRNDLAGLGEQPQPQPQTRKEFEALLVIVAGRLEAIALSPESMDALRELLVEDPDKAVQVCAVLRGLIKHSL